MKWINIRTVTHSNDPLDSSDLKSRVVRTTLLTDSKIAFSLKEVLLLFAC